MEETEVASGQTIGNPTTTWDIHKSSSGQDRAHRADPQGSRLRILFTVFMFEALLLVWFIRRDPFLVAGINTALHPVRAESPAKDKDALRNDPQLGTPLPHTSVGDSIRNVAAPSSVGYLLVSVGDCASCIKADLHRWQREAKASGVSMVLITSASKASAQEFMDRMNLRVPFALDPSEAMEST